MNSKLLNCLQLSAGQPPAVISGPGSIATTSTTTLAYVAPVNVSSNFSGATVEFKFTVCDGYIRDPGYLCTTSMLGRITVCGEPPNSYQGLL